MGLGWALGLTAALAQPRVERSWVDSPEMLLGMPNAWHVRLHIPPQSRLEVVPSDTLRGLEWWGPPIVDTDTAAPPLTLHVRLPFSGFDSGTHTLAAQWRVIDAQGKATLLEVPAPQVRIYWPDIDTAEGLRPIHPIFPPPPLPGGAEGSARPAWPWLLAALLLIALAAAWWIYRRRRKALPPLEKILSPYDYARHRLRTLQHQKLWQEGRVWEYYTELSHIVRKFLEDEHRLPILETPSSEIPRLLQRHGVHGDYATLQRFLQLSDMVKFARYRPAEHQHTEAFQWAERTIESFRKVEHPPNPPSPS